jgi:hypothetical protein
VEELIEVSDKGAGDSNGRVFIVMGFCPGVPLLRKWDAGMLCSGAKTALIRNQNPIEPNPANITEYYVENFWRSGGVPVALVSRWRGVDGKSSKPRNYRDVIYFRRPTRPRAPH